MAAYFHHVFAGVGPGGYEQGYQYLVQHQVAIHNVAEMNSVRGLFGQILAFPYAVGYVDSVQTRKADHRDCSYPVWCSQGYYGFLLRVL